MTFHFPDALLRGTFYPTANASDEVERERERELLRNRVVIQKDQAEEPWSSTSGLYASEEGFEAPPRLVIVQVSHVLLAFHDLQRPSTAD